MNCDVGAPNERPDKSNTRYLFEQLETLSEHNRRQSNEIERLEALAATKDVSVTSLMTSYEQTGKGAKRNEVPEVPRRASQTILSLKGMFEEQASKQDTLDKQCQDQTAEIEALRKENDKLKKNLYDQEKVSSELSTMVDQQATESERLISMVEQQREKIKGLEKTNESLESKLKAYEKENKKKRISFKDQDSELIQNEKEAASLKRGKKTTQKKVKEKDNSTRKVIDEKADESNEEEALALLQKLREKDSEAAALLDLLGEDEAKKEALRLVGSKQKKHSSSVERNIAKLLAKQEDKKTDSERQEDDLHLRIDTMQLDKDLVEGSLRAAKEENARLEKLLKEQREVTNMAMEISDQLRSEIEGLKSKSEYFESVCKNQSSLVSFLKTENEALYEKFMLEEDALDLKRKRESSILPTKDRNMQDKLQLAELEAQSLKQSVKEYETKLKSNEAQLEQVMKENKMLNDRIQSPQLENSRVQELSKSLEDSKERQRVEIQTLADDNNLLSEELENMKTDSESLFVMLENGHLTGENLKVLELEKIRESIQATVEEMNKAVNKSRVQGQQIITLEKEVESLEKRLSNQRAMAEALKAEKNGLLEQLCAERQASKANGTIDKKDTISDQLENPGEVKPQPLSTKLNLNAKKHGRIPASLRSLAPVAMPEKSDIKSTSVPSPVNSIRSIGTGSLMTTVTTASKDIESSKGAPSPVHSMKSLGTGSLHQRSEELGGRKDEAETEDEGQEEPPRIRPMLHDIIDIADMRRDVFETTQVAVIGTTNDSVKGASLDISEASTKQATNSKHDKLTHRVSFSLPSTSSEDESASSNNTEASIDGDNRLPIESQWLKDAVQ